MCIERQFRELRQKYQYLFLQKRNDDYIINGTIFFEKDDIKDQYEVEIQVPADYPKKIPTAKETGSKISLKFHHFTDETLCLETPLTIHEIFRKNETLLNFTDNLLIPYLYIHSYYIRHGKFPFGEHAHGAEGILEDYKNRFHIANDSTTVKLLQILAENKYRGHHLCPCESGKRLRNCHGQYLLQLLTIPFNFMKDYLEILVWIKETKNFDVTPFISKKVKTVLTNPNHKWSY